MPPEHSLEALAAALTHPEWDVRFDALKELKHYHPEQAVPLLLIALSDEASSLRRDAVNILAAYRDRRAVEPLIPLLDDEDFLVRGAVAEALGILGDARAIDALLAHLASEKGYPQTLVLAALTTFPPTEVVQAFIRACTKHTERLARHAIAFARGPWEHEQLVPLLIEALADADWWVRRQAVEELAKRKESRTVDLFLPLLSDEHPSVRLQAIEALGQINDARAIDPLMTQLAEQDERLRIATVRVLARFEDQRVAQAFERLLTDDPSPQIRATLASVLPQWSQDQAVPLLLNALADPDAAVRRNVLHALGNIGDWRATRPLIALLADDALRIPALEALGKCGDEQSIDVLLSHLLDREAGIEVHLAAATALASFHTPVVAQTFRQAIEDPTLKWLRSAVTYALGQWKHEQAIPLLLTALVDEDRQVRWRAAEALAKQPDTRAIPQLLVALKDEQIAVRCRAIEALGKTGEECVIAPLLKQLADKEKLVRVAAATALRTFHRPEVVQGFLTALQKGSGASPEILAAFEQWRERQAIAPLVAMLETPRRTRDDQVRLIQILARISADERVEALIQKIADHQGDSDAYIFCIDGKAMRWDDAVDMAREQILRRVAQG